MKNYHPADLVDILRKIENLIRPGVVYQTNGDRVKVRTGELITAWLPWFTHRAGKSRTWWRPSVGEQVFILSPNGNLALGCVLPSIFSDANPAPAKSEDGYFVTFPDGASFKYEPETSQLTIKGIKTAIIEASDQITAKAGSKIQLDTPLVECSDHVTFKSFSASGGGAKGSTGTLTGNVIHTQGQLSSNGIVLDSHTHIGVKAGVDSTGKPQ
ncbi:phage baseplate assembly protein V [Gilliamella sp. M0320]|uniref:phage baseplate assembly protein V n=1 Tax=Gilliamella sp. M0320 TaxID=2750965 RepID=UPI0018DCCF3C|nr:phage baseplate assembly protein V [Gilliamella sp. M0320]MBI0060301.1 phage baseplate assembly protein V [Gilliamella sp. M0320]